MELIALGYWAKWCVIFGRHTYSVFRGSNGNSATNWTHSPCLRFCSCCLEKDELLYGSVSLLHPKLFFHRLKNQTVRSFHFLLNFPKIKQLGERERTHSKHHDPLQWCIPDVYLDLGESGLAVMNTKYLLCLWKCPRGCGRTSLTGSKRGQSSIFKYEPSTGGFVWTIFHAEFWGVHVMSHFLNCMAIS